MSLSADRSLWGKCWPYCVLAGLTVIFFFQLLVSPLDERLGGIDIIHYFQWIHQYIRDELSAGRLPLWNPYNYGGIPFAANPQCSVFYPLSWLYLLVPVIHAHKWMIALHAFLAGLFMHLYLRRAGVGQTAATVACLPWMFGSYFMANAAVGHLTMIFTMTWLPIALYCYERALESRQTRWLFWTGFVLGVQILAGEPQNCYYTALLVSTYGLIRSMGRDVSDRAWWHPARFGRWLTGLAIIGVLAVLASGIQFFLTAEYLFHSDRVANTYDFATNRSFPPGSFLGFLIPWSSDVRGMSFIAGEKILYVETNWEFAGYIGIFTLVLAGLSLNVRRNPPLLAAKVLFAGALVLMLGRYTPLYHLLYAGLPGLNLFRIPARALVIAVWALSVMAAFGLDWMIQPGELRWRAVRWRRIAMAALTLVGMAVILQVSFGGVSKQVPKTGRFWETVFQTINLTDVVILGPIVLPLVGLLLLGLLPLLPRRAVIAGVALLVGADLFWAMPDFHLQKYSSERDDRLQALSRLRSQIEAEGNPCRFDASPRDVTANLALAARVENINGYWPFALGRFYRFVHWMRGYTAPIQDRHQFNERIYEIENAFPLRVMNVRYGLQKNSATETIEWLENPCYLPRAWLVERFEVIPDEEAALQRLKDPAFDPAAAVLLERDPGIQLAPSDSPIGSCTARRVEGPGLDIHTDTVRPGLLVISETFYPGWRAFLDDKPVSLMRANDVISALCLPAGKHRITLRYEPLSFKLGCAATGLSLLAAILLLVTGRRRVAGR
ncbi:MAG TPA: glycosyltransferase family 39 protein [Phycisphaerae bacterium]|nr:glycosyltransferase family 39 protein [Phycisphaerae bacterium]